MTLLSEFEIERSLSQKGNPYDNAVAEATFKILENGTNQWRVLPFP